MTDILVNEFDSRTLVDGSEAFCTDLRERHPNVSVVHASSRTSSLRLCGLAGFEAPTPVSRPSTEISGRSQVNL
jgi:hypothetical protein